MHRYSSTGYIVQKYIQFSKRSSNKTVSFKELGQIPAHVFELNEDFCSYNPSNTFATHRIECLRKATICCIGCLPFSVLWYNFMNKQSCPFFCNNTAILYSFILNTILEERCHCSISKIWELGNITRGIS